MINNTKYTINVRFNSNNIENNIDIKAIDQKTAEVLLALLKNKKLMSFAESCPTINDKINYMSASSEFHNKFIKKIIDKYKLGDNFKDIREIFFTIYRQNQHRGKYSWFNPFYTKRVETIKKQLENIVEGEFSKTVKNNNSIFFHAEKRSYFSTLIDETNLEKSLTLDKLGNIDDSKENLHF